MRVLFAGLYWNEFEDVSNLGATAGVEVEKLVP
jgi:hypothetical protein